MTHPATAAEALSGLIRLRPHGWLASPLPTDPAAVTDHLHTALADHEHPAAAEPLRVLAARATAAVASLGNPPRAVLKLHADPDAYNAELVAYALVGNSPVLPRLLSLADTSYSLLIEYVPHSFDWTVPDAPATVVDAVAAVHVAPDLLDAAAADIFTLFRLDRLAAATATAWLPDPGAWRAVLDLCRDAYGGSRIPVGHLDLKPEHVRLRDDGALALLDVETLRPDITGLIDLITLPAVLRQAGRPLPGPDVRALYQHAAARHGLHWTTNSLRAALIAYQRATGLATLDQLAD
ncbi:hypothetical protein [Streptomyces sp. NPDC004296]|uniref:hypothetical protein n=1 Tax=Streptomyces sp. NPDC004296 TaxID=3364697 RepID=UPI0036CC7037